jgi:hypothetical protein
MIPPFSAAKHSLASLFDDGGTVGQACVDPAKLKPRQKSGTATLRMRRAATTC